LHFKSVLVFILTALIVVPLPAQQPSPPQQPAPAAPAPTPEPSAIKIVVLQGEGARNGVKSKTAVSPVVEVQDEKGKPVEGSEVVFQLPAAGPGGIFHGWMRTQTVRTNAQGQAGVSGYVPNDQEGRFNIKVTATKGSKSDSVVIAQINTRTTEAAKSRKGLWWTLAGVAGAGAAIGIVAATRDGGSTATGGSTPVTITPGGVTVTAPK